MIKPLLIEIAVEELPAIPFLKELPNIEKKWMELLESNNLLCEFKFYYTPRRLVFWHRSFKIKQEDTVIESYGPPVKIAFKDQKPTKAAYSFAKKCSTNVEDLDRKIQKKGEVLYYKNKIEGKYSKDLLNDMLCEFINKLNFGKSMRWGNIKNSFIRPIRGLSVVLGDQLVDAELFGIKSSKSSFAHKMVSYDRFDFDTANDYFCKLDKNGVILYQEQRKEIILNQMNNLQNKYNISIEIDKELLNEIVAITEYPTVLIGKFDEEFLELPNEVIIGSMKEHQRYFAVYKNNELTNKFIVVSNAYTDNFNQIIAGNERVLRPRLSDAMFFYRNDIKNGLQNDGLNNITFVDGLGSMYDKSKREFKIACYISKTLDIEIDLDLLEKTIMLSKADLLTDMVYEFTELQGIMGYYYAKNAKEDESLCIAIKEQYLPNGQYDSLPSSIFSSIIALSNKLDSLIGLFSVGMIPTGSRDPYALRRAATGIIKICIKYKINLNINDISEYFNTLYNNPNKIQLLEFFNDRLYKIYSNINPSIIKAVIKSGESNILKICQKIEALAPFVQSSDFKELSLIFKRVANITKDINLNSKLIVDQTIFQENIEEKLYNQLNIVNNKNYTTYDEKLEDLFNLKTTLYTFFDTIFINHKNKEIKINRKNLIGTVYKSFRTIADIKEITDY